MANIQVDFDLCKACGLCIAVCPFGLLSLGHEANSKGYHAAVQENADKCSGCKLCATMCPDSAITVYKD